MKIITLVGCGEIGFRHLQALLKLDGPLLIQAVARSESSLKNMRSKVDEPSIYNKGVQIEWLSANEKLQKADLCIIATTAINRVNVVFELLEQGNKRFLIEKMVCQSESQYDDLLDAFNRGRAKGWVNCNRRYSLFYRDIKGKLSKGSPITFKVNGGNYGLGCNAIHFMDLFDFLGGDTLVQLDGRFLNDEIYENRRSKNLVEFCGTLIGATDQRSFFDITFNESPRDVLSILITGDGVQCHIDEAGETARIAERSDDWQWRDLKIASVNVSDTTTIIANDILESDESVLASLEESRLHHKLLFDVFNRHIEKVTGARPTACPIT